MAIRRFFLLQKHDDMLLEWTGREDVHANEVSFGPAGIIRRTRKVEDTQGMKRKRDVIDRCNNM